MGLAFVLQGHSIDHSLRLRLPCLCLRGVMVLERHAMPLQLHRSLCISDEAQVKLFGYREANVSRVKAD